MTANKRIFLNIVATYGRSLYSLVLGLFTARWALQALGQVDYGLIGLVGAMAGFVTFFNSILGSAVGRFYAVSVGAARKQGGENAGLEDCWRWFNTALSIHTIIPFALTLVGYPIGEWCVRNFLTIPPDRLVACVWVWRFTCISCLIGMVSVPFNAMYTAKQEIAELTVYSFFTTTANALFLYFMITHPGDWLARYSFGTLVIGITPQLIIIVRALVKYRECRIVFSYWFNLARYKELLKYVFARFWSEVSSMVYTQGMPVLVNKYEGSKMNASMTVGTSLAIHSQTLSSSLTGALWPAIANLAGEGKREDMMRLCIMSCRMGAVLMLVFAIPLSLEVDEVLHLWLVNPPAFSAQICIALLIRQVFELMTSGHWMGILARGVGVVQYSWTIGWAGISSVGIAWICFACGLGMWSVVIAALFSKLIDVLVRMYYGATLLDFRAKDWGRNVFAPIFCASAITIAAGLLPRLAFAPSFSRVVMTTCVCEIVFFSVLWIFVLKGREKQFILEKCKCIVSKLR